MDDLLASSARSFSVKLETGHKYPLIVVEVLLNGNGKKNERRIRHDWTHGQPATLSTWKSMQFPIRFVFLILFYVFITVFHCATFLDFDSLNFIFFVLCVVLKLRWRNDEKILYSVPSQTQLNLSRNEIQCNESHDFSSESWRSSIIQEYNLSGNHGNFVLNSSWGRSNSVSIWEITLFLFGNVNVSCLHLERMALMP